MHRIPRKRRRKPRSMSSCQEKTSPNPPNAQFGTAAKANLDLLRLVSWVDTESPQPDSVFRFCRSRRNLQSSVQAKECDGRRVRSSAHAHFAGSSTSAASPHAADSCSRRRSHSIATPRQDPHHRCIADLCRQNVCVGAHALVPTAHESFPIFRPGDLQMIFRNRRGTRMRCACRCDRVKDRWCVFDNAEHSRANTYILSLDRRDSRTDRDT